MTEKNKNILILNGPNLNMLGSREPEHYGQSTLIEIEAAIKKKSINLGISTVLKQSNNEGELVTWIQEARKEFDGIIINAGAYTHTSIAIYDALKMVNFPIIEVHISNIYAREDFRQNSLISKVATGIIGGFGDFGYLLALQAVLEILVRKGN